MYAVIFRAQIKDPKNIDSTYSAMAARMRELATTQYGCIDFSSVTEGESEISISYWESMEQISAWKSDPEHQQAQGLGQSRWYRSYHVEVVKVERQYQSD
ncbi:MAG: antibiotic biosynthesis monooxygenase [Gammaproteobacteria bacterium]|nr:antibiotic biosynthesis monooxygenase [Gammaproteobacteria bacterium]